jgi:hypothetical protein
VGGYRYIKRAEEEDRELGADRMGSGEEFEGACKRRHGGGPDLNFYLLLSLRSHRAHLSSLSPLHPTR